MILVDTSVWVDHFRGRPRARRLERLLEDDRVLLHPWVLGELVLGNLGDRDSEITRDLRHLPTGTLVADDDVLEMIRSRSLANSGLGWVDVQLLASALVAGAELWTFDRRLTLAGAAAGVDERS